MQDVIEDHFKKAGKVATVKYIDPSYMIRLALFTYFELITNSIVYTVCTK
jgi:hypothetical protein